MLRATAYDYLLITPDGNMDDTFSEEYYEPGFNIMSPLEFNYPMCDRLSLRIKRRKNAAGTTFKNIDSVDCTVTVIDPTNNQAIPYTLVDEGNKRLRLTVTNALTLTNPVARARVIDVFLRHNTDNDFIIFRVLVEESAKSFHYFFVDANNMSDRNPVTVGGRDVYVSVKASGNYYMLISPYAYLREGTSSGADFSYPLNTVFYKRQNTYSNEDFSFSILSYSHAFMEDVISVMNVPSYGKAGVLLVDNRIYKDMTENGVNPYVDIAVIGELSGNEDVFRVNFMT